MRIYKAGLPPTEKYARVSNEIARGGLRLETLGLYTYLVSCPEGWHVNIRDNRPFPNGYKATQRALAELRSRNLIGKTKRVQLADGTFQYHVQVYVGQ